MDAKRWFSSFGAAPEVHQAVGRDIARLREDVLQLLHDCEGPGCERLRARLNRARSAFDLWQARSDLFDVLALRHCESQAVMRINALAPLFAGQVPDRLLRPLPGATAAD